MLVALTTMLALVLAGCGGDDNNDVEQDLRGQVAMLEGQVSDAQTAQAAAEAARMTAETAAADAMTAQMAAEAERDTANTAKGAAEQAQATAEAAQAEAETAQMAAETAQMTAEEAQAAAERMQAAAEAERDAAAGSLSAAEMARDAAKDAEAAALVAQAQAEAAQMNAEADSADAMAAQAAAEAAQATAEAAQAAAEMAAADAMTAQTAAEAAQAAAEEAQATAEMERDAANDAKIAAETAQATAETERDAANAAKMAAETVQATAEATATAAQAAQKDAKDKAEMYMDELAALRREVNDTTEADRNAAAKALIAVLINNNVAVTIPVGGTATTLRTAPTAETNADHNRTGLVGVTATALVGTDEATIAAARQTAANDVGALMVEVSFNGILTAEVEYNAAYSMSEMAPDIIKIKGWRNAMLTREQTDGTMDTVVVYSNISNTGDSWLDRYESTTPGPTRPEMWIITPLSAADGDPVTRGHIPWSVVKRPDTIATFTPAGTGSTAMLTFRGTVHNIPGIFSCTTGGATGSAQACKAPARYSDGTVSVLATTAVTDDGASVATIAGENTPGAWTFVLDSRVFLYTADTTYLTFGWWLLKDAAGNPEDFLAFSTATGLGVMRAAGNIDGGTPGTLPTPANGMFEDNDAVHTSGETIRGSATYSGAAAGKYATASTTADSYEGGHFTADATLTVDFDADLDGNTGTTDNNKFGVDLSGTIDNFMTGDTARPDWTVNLMVDNDGTDGNAVTPVASLVGAANARMLTSWSTGAAATGTGTWAAQWYGGVVLNAAGNAIIATGVPDAVVGTFNADIGTAARLWGAFGAMQDE